MYIWTTALFCPKWTTSIFVEKNWTSNFFAEMKLFDRFQGKLDGESESDARFGVGPMFQK